MGDALASGSDPVPACQVVGNSLARDGASLGDALAGLRHTWQVVTGRDPSYDASTALSVAWSDATLAYLHQLSCEDPMTGLSSLAHVRARIAELFRELTDSEVRDAYALVVAQLPARDGRVDPVSRALRLSGLGQAVRTVFAGGETIGRVGSERVVVLARRDHRLQRRVALVATLASGCGDPDLEDGTGVASGAGAARVWVEGLPAGDLAAGLVLDELARG